MPQVVVFMSAHVRVEVGMRVLSKDDEKPGTIKGFGVEYARPLDSKGRLPGTYVDPKYIDVLFEGETEVHSHLELSQFTLAQTSTTSPPTTTEAERIGDLPQPIAFWPGDTVRKADDVLQTPRLIDEVFIDKHGAVYYDLMEIEEEKEARLAEANARSATWSQPPDERYAADQLILVTRGNIYKLYHAPETLSFASPEDELVFWGTDGICENVRQESRSAWTLEEARSIVEAGNGDMVLGVSYQDGARMIHHREFVVLRLHDCFDQHRERVRMLSKAIEHPPAQKPPGDRAIDQIWAALHQ